MSIDIHYAKLYHSSNALPPLKSEIQVMAERDTFNAVQDNNTNNQYILHIYEIIRNIKDPEHPYTLEQLDVLNVGDIAVQDKGTKKYVTIYWKPSVPTCSFAMHIGLAVLLKLERQLGMSNVKLSLLIKPGCHKHAKTIDRQLNDKERVAAARENQHLMNLVESLVE